MNINLSEVINWLETNVFSMHIAIQIGVLLLFAILSYFLSGTFKKEGLQDGINKILSFIKYLSRTNINNVISKLIWPITGIVLIWLYILLAVNLELPHKVLMGAAHLLDAWIIIQLLTSFVQSKFLSRFVAGFIWVVAALKILNIYDDLVTTLDGITFSSGDYSVSVLTIIKGIIIVSILFFVADKVSNALEKRINKLESLTPSARVLTRKFLRIALMIIAALIGLSTLGINLTAFAFLGGTIGVGLGFGLQKVVSNFVSGVIILMDKSVKPGDVIEINDNYGYINSLGTRFVSLITRGGKEFLIPNEDFITQTVINWSYSDRMVRIDVPIGISYNSDLEEVVELIPDSIKDIGRINTEPEPKCIVEEFGDSSINLVFRFWISDPDQGVANIKSDVLLRIWSLFKENNIEIPYPQRDLHIRSEEETGGNI